MVHLELALPILALLAFLSLLEALYSLAGGFSYRRLLRGAAARPAGPFSPPVSLILPCRGEDPGLHENLQAYFQQDYPDFQILLVTDQPADPCVSVFQQVAQRHASPPAHLLFSGASRSRGQKVHNLLHALEHLRERDEVLAFGDSDIRPSPEWLRYLVAPLENEKLGVSTGYRWYLPEKGSLAAILRSAWNAGVASLMKQTNCHFAWGGAMAIRRATFQACRVTEYWHNALSDDYAISRAMQESDLEIAFQPRCLSFSYGNCTWKELLEFVFRQLAITRVYSPGLWLAGFISQALNFVSFWGGAVWLGTSTYLGIGSSSWRIVLGLLLAGIYGLGCAKSGLRLWAIGDLMRKQRSQVFRNWPIYVFTGPLVAVLTLWGMLSSLFKREIEWRGIRYRMISPRRTVVLGKLQGP